MTNRLKVRLGRRGHLVRLPAQMVWHLNLRAGDSLSLTAESDGSYRLAKVPAGAMGMPDDDDQYEHELPQMPGVTSPRRVAEDDQWRSELMQGKLRREQQSIVEQAEQLRRERDQWEYDARKRSAREADAPKPCQPAPHRKSRPHPAPEPGRDDPEMEMEV